jgi:hypothetical protein
MANGVKVFPLPLTDVIFRRAASRRYPARRGKGLVAAFIQQRIRHGQGR